MILAQWEVSGLIEKGGPLVWVLLALGFFGSVCVVERLFYFHRARINVSSLLVGLGVAVLSLSAAYWLVSRPRTPIFPEPRTEQATPYRDRDPSPPPGDGARR